jgi:small GTP-binding protein
MMSAVQKKVCLLGDFAVGKTSLIRRYVEGRFDEKYLSTIGVKISRKVLQRPDHELNLLIWDLAGGDDIDQLSRRYLLGAVGALLVCDLTRPETLDVIRRYAKVMHEVNRDSALILAGNKADLEEERALDDQRLADEAEALSLPWLLTSAKDGQGVEEAFELLAGEIEQQP